MSKPLQLFQRAEVRLALAAGISNGFAVISGLPFAYYAPLSVLAAMGTNYGSTLELGRQRLLGTLLGAVVLLVCFEGLRDVPLPLGIAIALGSQRLLGGLLRLEVGYKVGGLVIVMGWLAHNDQFGAWIPLRLFWSVLGIIVSLLSMELLWPSSGVLEGWQQWSTLCGQLAQALGQVAALLGQLLFEHRQIQVHQHLPLPHPLTRGHVDGLDLATGAGIEHPGVVRVDQHPHAHDFGGHGP